MKYEMYLPRTLLSAIPSAGAVDFIALGGLAPSIAQLYGSWVTSHVALARARVLATIGRVSYPWRATHIHEGRPLLATETVPTRVEPELLQHAKRLLVTVLDAATARKPLVQESTLPEIEAVTAKTGKDAKKDAKKPEPKKGGKPAAPLPEEPTSEEYEAWHCQVLVACRMQVRSIAVHEN